MNYEMIHESNTIVMHVQSTDHLDDSIVEFYCFYDMKESEYFICGKRIDENVNTKEFKFYCKTRINLLEFIETMIGDNSKINVHLCNYTDLFVDYEYVDYTIFDNIYLSHLEDECISIISQSYSKNFSKKIREIMEKNLKLMKFVRW